MAMFKLKKVITACLFFAFIFYSAWMNWDANHAQIMDYVNSFVLSEEEPSNENMTRFVSETQSIITDNVADKYSYIEGYGYLQRLMLKNEVENFSMVKDSEGHMHYTYFTTGPNETVHLASQMGRLNQVAEAKGAEVIYLMTPDKYERGVTEYEVGLPYNYANETADQFLGYLQNFNVEYIDFRELMSEQGRSTEESFYKTDHHWNIETTFWAYTQLVEELEKRHGLNFNNKDYVTDINNYNQIVYEDAYLGSMGRSVGQLYTDIEDFTLIYPKFETDFFVYEASGTNEVRREGRFENSILNTSILTQEGDKYSPENDKYFTYMDGNPGIVQVMNQMDDTGPRVLFIKDSLIVPVASFFSLGTEDTMMVDPRYYGGSIEEIVEEGDFDYIFVSYSPQNLTDQFFPFYLSE